MQAAAPRLKSSRFSGFTLAVAITYSICPPKSLLLAHGNAQQADHLVDSGFPAAILDGVINAGFEMLRNDEQRHFPHRGGDRACLLHLVAAIAIVLDHLPQAPHLTFDPVQALKKRLLLVGGSLEIKPIVTEIVLHCKPSPTSRAMRAAPRMTQ